MSEALDIIAEHDLGRLPHQTVLDWFTAHNVNGVRSQKRRGANMTS